MAHILLPYLTIISRKEITRGIVAESFNRLEGMQSTRLIVKMASLSILAPGPHITQGAIGIMGKSGHFVSTASCTTVSVFVSWKMSGGDTTMALKTWELSNNIETVNSVDEIFKFDRQQQQEILQAKPWQKE